MEFYTLYDELDQFLKMEPECLHPAPQWMIRGRHEVRVANAVGDSVIQLITKETLLTKGWAGFSDADIVEVQKTLLRDVLVVKQQSQTAQVAVLVLFNDLKKFNVLECSTAEDAAAVCVGEP